VYAFESIYSKVQAQSLEVDALSLKLRANFSKLRENSSEFREISSEHGEISSEVGLRSFRLRPFIFNAGDLIFNFQAPSLNHRVLTTDSDLTTHYCHRWFMQSLTLTVFKSSYIL
jgi:hypothetical protein